MTVGRDRSVFVNCPFDAAYKPLFDAIVFTIVACGFQVRSALETNDAGELRLVKIVRLIAGSRLSIHDVSRIELDQSSGFPRFNMPIELGMAIGAKYLGRAAVKDHQLLVFDTEPFRYQQFASDLAGLDIVAHRGLVDGVVAGVRNFLAPQTSVPLPGTVALKLLLEQFEASLPQVALVKGQRLHELTYTDRLLHLNDYLQGSP